MRDRWRWGRNTIPDEDESSTNKSKVDISPETRGTTRRFINKQNRTERDTSESQLQIQQPKIQSKSRAFDILPGLKPTLHTCTHDTHTITNYRKTPSLPTLPKSTFSPPSVFSLSSSKHARKTNQKTIQTTGYPIMPKLNRHPLSIFPFQPPTPHGDLQKSIH